MPQEPLTILATYRALLGAGDEGKASAYLAEALRSLPQGRREEVLGHMLTIALEDEAVAEEAVAKLQEEGIEAFGELDELEKEGGEATRGDA